MFSKIIIELDRKDYFNPGKKTSAPDYNSNKDYCKNKTALMIPNFTK